MELREELDYRAGADSVFAMLCDEAFRREVCEATHALSHQVSVRDEDGVVLVRVSRVLPAEVPDIVKRMVGSEIEIVQTERWHPPAADGSREAELSLDVTGQPAGMVGSMRLVPDGSTAGGRTRQLVRGEITVKVPFVGGKMEAEVARGVRAALAREQEVGRRWLAGSPG